ncbi:formyltransferase family protein [Chloroflexus sp.]|uniref:formyltransferase family protein n=1 Tax=Chloroflexus sp. TaxID=1904827 RepID=UPI002ACEC471|nr:formyltransferase family protein [Chloroflexus sp.]
MRIVLFAMPGPMALPILQRLLELPVHVAGLVHPAPPGLPTLTRLLPATPTTRQEVVTPANLAILADRAGIPRWAVGRAGMLALAEQLAAQQIDLALVACWPWRIPADLLRLPQRGFLNVHPSPLPAMRGPEPLFWALRLGWTRTAMTLHLMDEALDHGPIVRQEWFELPLGKRLSAMEALAGRVAAQMLPAALADLATADWQPQPQPTGGSYYPAPQATDFTFTADWAVQRAYVFVHAVAEWGQPFTFIATDNQTVTIADAITYRKAEQQTRPIVTGNDQIALQLRDGILLATPASRSQSS